MVYRQFLFWLLCLQYTALLIFKIFHSIWHMHVYIHLFETGFPVGILQGIIQSSKSAYLYCHIIHYFHTFGLTELGWDLVVENTITTFQSMQYVQLSLRLYHVSTVFWVWKEDSLGQLTKPHDTLIELTQYPHRFTLESEYMAIIECFIVIMCRKGCGAKRVNEARHHLLTTGKKSLDNILPTQAALYKHVKRALILVSFIGVRLLLFS